MIVLVAIACLAGATVQSAIGFGFALILTPAMFAAVEPAEALPTILLLSLTINALVLGSERRRLELMRPELARIALAAIPGIVAGALVFGSLTKESIQIAVGVLVIAAAALDARTVLPGLRRGDGASALPLGAAVPCGLLSGFLTTTTTTNGPPLVFLLRARGASPAQLRDSNASMLLLTGAAALVAVVLIGPGIEIDPVLTAGLAVLGVAGQIAGRMVFARLDPSRFHGAGLAIILATGVASLAAGLSALG